MPPQRSKLPSLETDAVSVSLPSHCNNLVKLVPSASTSHRLNPPAISPSRLSLPLPLPPLILLSLALPPTPLPPSSPLTTSALQLPPANSPSLPLLRQRRCLPSPASQPASAPSLSPSRCLPSPFLSLPSSRPPSSPPLSLSHPHCALLASRPSPPLVGSSGDVFSSTDNSTPPSPAPMSSASPFSPPPTRALPLPSLSLRLSSLLFADHHRRPLLRRRASLRQHPSPASLSLLLPSLPLPPSLCPSLHQPSSQTHLRPQSHEQRQSGLAQQKATRRPRPSSSTTTISKAPLVRRLFLPSNPTTADLRLVPVSSFAS